MIPRLRHRTDWTVLRYRYGQDSSNFTAVKVTGCPVSSAPAAGF